MFVFHYRFVENNRFVIYEHEYNQRIKTKQTLSSLLYISQLWFGGVYIYISFLREGSPLLHFIIFYKVYKKLFISSTTINVITTITHLIVWRTDGTTIRKTSNNSTRSVCNSSWTKYWKRAWTTRNGIKAGNPPRCRRTVSRTRRPALRHRNKTGKRI